jgi:hypothetical protein
MKKNIRKIEVSELYEIQVDSHQGKNLLGFFISFPDGSIKNIVAEFDHIDYLKVAEKMKKRRLQELSKYNSEFEQNEEFEVANHSPP